VSPQCGDHRTCPCGGLSVWVGDCWRCSGQNPRDVAGWRERALAAEARVRDLEDTVGELLELIPDGLGDGVWTRIA
jgi:hypothetical protein